MNERVVPRDCGECVACRSNLEVVEYVYGEPEVEPVMADEYARAVGVVIGDGYL